MERTSQTAHFISARIGEIGKSQRQIAKEAGFDSPNVVSMIKTGTTKLPLAKIGSFAKAVNMDPVQLLQMCMHEYYPQTWEIISPLFDSALTCDELALVKSLRSAIGGPYVMTLTPKERKLLNDFLHALRKTAPVH